MKEAAREGPEPVEGVHYHQQPKELLFSSVVDSNLMVSVFVLVVFFQLRLQPLYEPLQPLFQLQLQLV